MSSNYVNNKVSKRFEDMEKEDQDEDLEEIAGDWDHEVDD
jgi:hypothetical protein